RGARGGAGAARASAEQSHDGLSLGVRRAEGRGSQGRRAVRVRGRPERGKHRERRRNGDLEARSAPGRAAAAALRVSSPVGAGRRALPSRHVRGHGEVTMVAPEYWFPAKRYGGGWGPPRTWPGCLVLAVYHTPPALGRVAPPHRRPPVRRAPSARRTPPEPLSAVALASD